MQANTDATLPIGNMSSTLPLLAKFALFELKEHGPIVMYDHRTETNRSPTCQVGIIELTGSLLTATRVDPTSDEMSDR